VNSIQFLELQKLLYFCFSGKQSELGLLIIKHALAGSILARMKQKMNQQHHTYYAKGIAFFIPCIFI
jgi:hypothetical protein